VSVLPSYFAERSGLEGVPKETQRFAGHAFSGEPASRWVVRLRHAAAPSVGAGAVAAEDQFALVSPQETGGELRIARERVISVVGGEVGEQVGVVAEQLIRDAAGLDFAGLINVLICIVRADVGPEGIGVADESRLRVGLQDGFESLEAGGESSFCRCMRTSWKWTSTGTLRSAAKAYTRRSFGPAAATWDFNSPNPIAPALTCT
jgi:hypothetical protein